MAIQINNSIKDLSAPDLSKLMTISPKLSDLNWLRNQDFQKNKNKVRSGAEWTSTMLLYGSPYGRYGEESFGGSTSPKDGGSAVSGPSDGMIALRHLRAGGGDCFGRLIARWSSFMHVSVYLEAEFEGRVTMSVPRISNNSF